MSETLATPDELAGRLYDYIGGTLRGNKCGLLDAGGMPDHVHLLVSLARDLSTADLLRLVKCNSSRWVHETFPGMHGFAWQTGYGAFAVSVSQLDAVKAYIAHQEEHHRTRSYQDEFRAFLRTHGQEWDEQYVWD